MFDPYHKWLGILPKDQPPNHYRLLSLETFESDLDVIEGAADRAMGFIRNYQSGEHAGLAAKLLNEIAAARLCLLRPTSKTEYDAKLRKQLAVSETAKDDNPGFTDDDEMAELMKAPKLLPKSKSKRSKRKKNSSQELLMAGGAGAGVFLVLILLFIGMSGKSRQATVPKDQSVAAVVPKPTTTAVVPTESKRTAPTELASSTISLIESNLIVQPTGPPVDLIAAVDPKRDAFVGELEKKGLSLILNPQGRFYFPAQLPPSYQLKFKMKRLSGNDVCSIGFCSGGRMGMAVFDGWNSKFSGLGVDGRDPDNNCTRIPGALFENGRASTIILTVHPNRVNATFDGQKIIDWHGQPERFFVHPLIGMPNRESPLIATFISPFEIESAELILIQPEPEPKRVVRLGGSVNVMPLLDTERDAQQGIWALNKNTLRSPATAYSKYSLPVSVPEEYTLSAIVELPAESPGNSALVVGLVVGKSWCSIPIVNGDSLGLERIDGIRWNANETRLAGTFLTPRKPVNLSCTVTKGGIRMELDSRTLLQWSGDFRRLSPQDDWAPPDVRKLYFGANANFKLSEITLGPPVDSPPLPAHPPMAVGKPVDLLSLVDPKRDALSGIWTRDKASLRVMGDVEKCQLLIPCEVPAEYKLTMRLAREMGGLGAVECLTLNLPLGPFSVGLYIDGKTSTVSGIDVDRMAFDDPKNLASRRGRIIPFDQTPEIVIDVRKTGVKVMNGNDTVIDWTGTPERLMRNPYWATPAGRIALGSLMNRFRFEKLEIEPLEPSSFPSIAELGSDGNLLSIIDPQRDSRNGQWKLDANALVSPTIPAARIRIPSPVPQRYVISANVERKVGKDALMLGFVVDGNPGAAVIDGVWGSQAGLLRLDGRDFSEPGNPTRRAYKTPLLPIGQSVNLRCVVLPDTIIVGCDDKEVLRWHGDARRFSQVDQYLPSNYGAADRNHLWLGAWESEFSIRDLQLKPLGDDEANKISASFSGVFPTTSQADVPLKSLGGVKFP